MRTISQGERPTEKSGSAVFIIGIYAPGFKKKSRQLRVDRLDLQELHKRGRHLRYVSSSASVDQEPDNVQPWALVLHR